MLLDFNIIKGPCRETKEIIKREMELIFQEIALDKPKQSQKLMKTKRKKMKYFHNYDLIPTTCSGPVAITNKLKVTGF